MSDTEREVLSASAIPAATRGPDAKCIIVLGGFPNCRCTRLIPCRSHTAGATGGSNMSRNLPQYDQGAVSPFVMKKATIEDERRLMFGRVRHDTHVHHSQYSNLNTCCAFRRPLPNTAQAWQDARLACSPTLLQTVIWPASLSDSPS